MATMLHATCRNADCDENGVDKPVGIDLGEDEPVSCGHCGQPCELATKPVQDVAATS